MTIIEIPIWRLAIVFIPVLIVLVLMWRWQLGVGKATYALGRMLAQLLLIGYALVFIFAAESGWAVVGILAVMLLASSWIALNTVRQKATQWFVPALLAIIGGGLTVLLLITVAVLQLEPWYWPQYMIPLAGMVLANAMNSVSIAAERLNADVSDLKPYATAQRNAFNAAMIPVINSLFAVGLVALPGMMTGQILAGVSPFIAARYQIMIMAMMFGSAGIATMLFLWLVRAKALIANDEANDEQAVENRSVK